MGSQYSYLNLKNSQHIECHKTNALTAASKAVLLTDNNRKSSYRCDYTDYIAYRHDGNNPYPLNYSGGISLGTPGKSNILYMDGHAGSVRYIDIWTAPLLPGFGPATFSFMSSGYNWTRGNVLLIP